MTTHMTRSIEERHFFANRFDFKSSIEAWLDDTDIHRVWFTDRYWMKDATDRFEVIIQWEE